MPSLQIPIMCAFSFNVHTLISSFLRILLLDLHQVQTSKFQIFILFYFFCEGKRPCWARRKPGEQYRLIQSVEHVHLHHVVGLSNYGWPGQFPVDYYHLHPKFMVTFIECSLSFWSVRFLILFISPQYSSLIKGLRCICCLSPHIKSINGEAGSFVTEQQYCLIKF